MKKFLTKISLLLALLLLVVLAGAKDIVIYHTSDTHGHYYSKYATWDMQNFDRKIGGYAVLKNLIDQEKNPYLLLDSGDFTRGSIEDNESKGKYAIEFMNKVGYDASIIGNHEFDYGMDNLKKRLKMAKFDFLNSNIYDKKGKLVKNTKPYKIYKVDGIKIAVIGVGRGYNSDENPWKTITAEKGIASVIEKASKKADAVIVLAHSSVKKEEAFFVSNVDVARFFPNQIDLFLGGHYHAEIQNYYDKKSGTVFIESGSYFNKVSRIVIDFDDNTKEIRKIGSKLVPLWVDIYGENEDIIIFGDKFKNKQADIIIGKSRTPIKKHSDIKTRIDSPLGSFISDVIQKYAGTQIAIQNSGGVRSDLGMGNITYRDMYNVLPFPNTITYMNVSGSFLQELFIDALKTEELQLQQSGLEITYTREKNKIKDLQICIDGKLINPKDNFTLATNDYTAKGGSEGKLFKKIQHKVITNTSVRDVVAEYIKNNKEISAPESGRIRIK